jgi:hypothetical protein
MKNFRPLFVIAAVAAALTAHAQVSYTNGPYSQNFNGLGTNSQAWANGATLPGWFGFTDVTTTASALTQLPTTGSQVVNAALPSAFADRALGASRVGAPTGSAPTFGLALVNNSGGTITSFTLSYTGKEFGVPAGEQLTFSYGLTAANLTAGTFVDVPSLSFGPLASVFLAGDGIFYGTTNLSSTVGLNWQNGQILWLRWTDTNFSNSGAVLAVDNITISTTAVPEPASLAALATIFAGSVLSRRRRNRA